MIENLEERLAEIDSLPVEQQIEKLGKLVEELEELLR